MSGWAVAEARWTLRPARVRRQGDAGRRRDGGTRRPARRAARGVHRQRARRSGARAAAGAGARGGRGRRAGAGRRADLAAREPVVAGVAPGVRRRRAGARTSGASALRLPPPLALLGKAAGLDARELTGRSLSLPGAGRHVLAYDRRADQEAPMSKPRSVSRRAFLERERDHRGGDARRASRPGRAAPRAAERPHQRRLRGRRHPGHPAADAGAAARRPAHHRRLRPQPPQRGLRRVVPLRAARQGARVPLRPELGRGRPRLPLRARGRARDRGPALRGFAREAAAGPTPTSASCWRARRTSTPSTS